MAFGKKKPKRIEITSIEQAMEITNREFGIGKVIFASQLYKSNADRVPTGSFSLDASIGGGIPIGYSVLFWGDKSSGKTTAAYRSVAAFQRRMPDKYPLYIASEQFDAENASANGIDLERCILILPESGEEAFDAAELLIRSRQISVIVIDSADALIPKAELEGSMEDMQRGASARMLNKALRKLFSVMQPIADENGIIRYENGLTAIWISQMRINQGVMFGNPEMYGGGKGYGHAMGIVVHFGAQTKGRTIIKENSQGKKLSVGLTGATEAPKNKTYPPNGTAEFDYYYSDYSVTKHGKRRQFYHGMIDHSKEIMNLALDYGILKGSASAFTYDNEKFNAHNFCYMLDQTPKETFNLIKQLCIIIRPNIPKRLAKYYSDRIRENKKLVKEMSEFEKSTSKGSTSGPTKSKRKTRA